MPAKSAAQYGLMQAVAHGTVKKKLKSLTPEVAREFIHKTPPEKRKMFAKKNARKR